MCHPGSIKEPVDDGRKLPILLRQRIRVQYYYALGDLSAELYSSLNAINENYSLLYFCLTFVMSQNSKSRERAESIQEHDQRNDVPVTVCEINAAENTRMNLGSFQNQTID